MKKQKKMTSIVAGIAMVALTAASLGTATYAWFTRGTEAQATGFNFTASAASGLQISTTGEAGSWKSSILAGDFGSGVAQTGSRLTVSDMDPISTNGVHSSGVLSFYSAEYQNDKFTVQANTEDFIRFNLYFLNEGTPDVTLQLRANSNATDDVENDKDTSLSTRVAFIKQGTGDQADLATVQAASAGQSTYLWEPNSTVRSTSSLSKNARPNAKYTYQGLSALPAGGEVGTAGINNYGLIRNNALYTGAVSTNDLAVGDADALTILPNGVTKVTVYIWIEGQDLDCDNSTSAGKVNLELYFDAAVASGVGADNVAAAQPSAVSTTAVTIGSTEDLGSIYKAFVLGQSTVDGVESEVSYVKLLATGSVTVETGAVTSISIVVMSGEAVSGTVDAVVVGTFSGAVTYRFVLDNSAVA